MLHLATVRCSASTHRPSRIPFRLRPLHTRTYRQPNRTQPNLSIVNNIGRQHLKPHIQIRSSRRECGFRLLS